VRETYRDDETLLDIERACGWQASVALLEIVHDPDCLRRLEELELTRALLRADLDPAAREGSAREGRGWERLAAAVAALFILLLLPGSPGGSATILAALGVAAVFSLLVPQLRLGPASSNP